MANKPDMSSAAQAYLDSNPDVKAEYEQFREREPEKWTPESYAAYHFNNYGVKENRAGSEGLSTIGNSLVDQILSSSDASKWKGEGRGSAQANAAGMAEILASIGVTDVKDFGEIPKYKKIETQIGPDGKPVYGTEQGGSYEGSDGEHFISNFVPVDQSKVVMVNGVPMMDTGQKTYGNKLTGQAVGNTYGERQTGNAFGGTYAGSGNTGYRVQFDAQGNPHFYTTEASSNSLVNTLQDNPILAAAANMAAAYFGGPAGVAALHAAMGEDIGDIAKAAAMSWAGGQIGNVVTGAAGEALNAPVSSSFGPDNIDIGGGWNPGGGAGSAFTTDALANTGAKMLGNAANQFVSSGGKADVGDLLLGGALNTGLNAVVNQIPGYSDLPSPAKAVVNSTVSSVIKSGGNLSEQQLLNAALAAGTTAVKSAKTGGGRTSGFGTGFGTGFGEGFGTGFGGSPTSAYDLVPTMADGGSVPTSSQLSDADVQLLQQLLGNPLSAPSASPQTNQTYASGGEIADLLHLLRS